MTNFAAIYSRVSTAEQSVGTSLDRQRNECLALARQHKFSVPDHLIFSDVMSGKRDDRPGYQALLAAAKDGKLERCYVWATDRFGRSLRAAVVAVDDLNKLGIKVLSVVDGDLSEPIRLALLSAIAQRELERIRERTLPPKLAKRDAGLFVVGRHPYGYIRRPDQRLEKCPVESRIVRRIFTDCIAGLGRVQIARRLNDDNELPLVVKVKHNGRVRQVRPGNLVGDNHDPFAFIKWCKEHDAEFTGSMGWSSRSIARVLANTASYGVLLSPSAKSPIILQIEGSPIISVGEFDAAQRALQDRVRVGRRPARPWLLTGAIACGTCGGSYIHHQGRRFHRYVCRSRKAGGNCTSPSVRMHTADLAAIRAARDLLSDNFGTDAKIARYLADHTADRDHLRMRFKELEGERVAAQSEWEGLDSLLLTLRDHMNRSSMPAAIKSAKAAKATLDAIILQIATVKDALNAAETGMQTTATELRAVVERIELASNLVVGGDDEATTDLLSVIRALTVRVVVHRDRSITTTLTKNPSAILGTLTRITTDAVVAERQDMTKAISRLSAA